jgi:hypothetical protein
MSEQGIVLSYPACRDTLRRRLAEPAPGRIQLVTGPRQVGKTTLLLELAQALGKQAHYVAADGPVATLPGLWDRLWSAAEATVKAYGTAVVLLDEAQHLPNWAVQLKARWDRLRRRRLPVHVVATGSSALRLASGSRESLAGRFECLTLTHWDAAATARVFRIGARRAADLVVERGAYPGAFALLGDALRWAAYVRDAIIEPAIGRDILSLATVRRPGLLRQVFGVCLASAAQIVTLQKMQGMLQDHGALETIAHYLRLLQEAHLVASLDKHASTMARRRAAPPKIVVLSNALLAATQSELTTPDRARRSQWVQNACLAHAWNAGQSVRYWREEPLAVDGIVQGTWGKWAIEIKLGEVLAADLRGLLEFCRRYPEHRPLVIGDRSDPDASDELGVAVQAWPEFLLAGPPGVQPAAKSKRRSR